jgi:hypothetical protein
MKWISPCSWDISISLKQGCSHRDSCDHNKPHEFYKNECILTDGKEAVLCDCIPMDLEYYMRKIIDEDKRNS